MKPNKKSIIIQRKLIDKKLRPWLPLRLEKTPPSGWLKAIRGSLGVSSRQLAQILGINSSAIIRLEEREPSGKVSLELLDRAARVMGCKLIYAIVPDEKYESLESIIDERARKVAKELLQKVEHSMRLEDQGSSESSADLAELIKSLKDNMDPRIWGYVNTKKDSK